MTRWQRMVRHPISLLLYPLAVIALTFGVSTTAYPADVTWSGGAGAASPFWDLPANWSPGLPGAGDNALISATFAPEFRSGTVSINSLQASGTFLLSGGSLSPANNSFINGVLTLSGGQIGGAGALTAGGATWTNGTMTGAGTTTLTGTVNLGLPGMVSQPVVNGGRVLQLNSGATFQGDGLFLAGGTLNVAAGQTFSSIGKRNASNAVLSDNDINNGTFNNAGTFVQDSGTRIQGGNTVLNQTAVSSDFTNTGTVNVQSGRLYFDNTGTSTGTLSVAAGAELQLFTSPGFNINAGALNNAGTLHHIGGTVTILPAVTVNNTGAWNFEGGTLIANNTINGNFTWTNGTMTGAGTTTLTGTVNLGLPGMVSQPVVNGGRVLQLNSGATFQGDGLFLAGGTLNVAAGQTFSSIGKRNASNAVLSDNDINNGTFNNAGTFVQDSGTRIQGGNTVLNQTAVSSDFTNTGTVNVQSGRLYFDNTGTSTGTLSVAAGAELQLFTSPGFNINAGALNNAGTLHHIGGTVTILPAVTVNNTGAWNFEGGTLIANNTINGNFTWTNGTMTGAGTTTLTGTVNLGLPGMVSQPVVNGGRVLQLNSGATFQGDGLFLAGGTLNVAAGQTFSSIGKRNASNAVLSDNDINNGTFNNAGTFVQDSGTRIQGGNTVLNQTAVSSDFTNTGTVNVQSGRLYFDNTGTSTGTLSVAAGAELQLFTSPGFNINAGALNNAGTLHHIGGTVTILPAVTVNNTGAWNFEGGTLIANNTINGNFTWTNGTMTGAGTTTLTGTVNLGLPGMVSQPVVNGGRVLQLNSGATFQGDGLFLAGGTLNVAAGQTFSSIGKRNASNAVLSDNDINNGTFNNAGTFVQDSGTRIQGGNTVLNQTAVSSIFNNMGTVDVKSGRLLLNNSFAMLSNASVLDLPIGALVNINFDVSATATLDGTIRLNFGFRPTVGQVITVFDYNNHIGTFDSVVGEGLAAGFVFTPIYNAGNFQVEVAAVPEPHTYALMLVGLTLLAWAGTRRRQV